MPFRGTIGCSPFASLCQRANPDEETTDWRAVCGRTARTVRRAGTARAVPDPYPVEEFWLKLIKTPSPCIFKRVSRPTFGESERGS